MTSVPVDAGDLTRYGPHYITDGTRYLLRLPGDAKAKGRTRATTFAKTIDDEANLAPWGETMGIVGVLTDTPTRAGWHALLAEHPDPWYGTPESKQRARELTKQAKERGGGGDRRDTGIALHTILHLVASGRVEPTAINEEWRAHVVNAVAVLAEAGLEIVPSLCEITVYNRIYDTIGRPDLTLRAVDDRYGKAGTLHIGDWKTGGATWRVKKDWKTKRQTGWVDGYDLADGPHVGQMTLYASASDIVVWPENQWDECRLIEMPEIDQTRGFIIHLPSTEPGNVSVRVLDLTIGRQWLDACKLVRDTRKLRPLVERIGAVEPAVPEIVPAASPAAFQGEASVLLTEAPPARTCFECGEALPGPSGAGIATGHVHIHNVSLSDHQLADPFDGLTDGHVDPPADPARRQWVIGRLEVLKSIDGALARVGQLWPAGLATLKNSDRHTDRDLDRIVTVLDAVEAEYTVTFGDKDPTKPQERKQSSSSSTSNTPQSTPPYETPKQASTTSTTASPPSTPPRPESFSNESAAPSTPSLPSSKPDEGPPADPDEVQALEARYKLLSAEARSWIAGIARDAQKAGRPITLYGAHTARRYEIVRGLVTLAAANYDDDEIVRGLMDLVVEGWFQFKELGVLLSTLDASEAKRFADLCAAYVGGTVTTAVDDDGRLVFTAST